MQVRFREAREIEQEAGDLLSTYSQAKGWEPAPPIPIEKLILFLGLHQEVVDLYEYLGVANDGSGDLLGAIFFESN